jgi:signal transduction histidine kinase
MNYPREVAGTVYLCCLEVLERAGQGARATVTVGDEGGALVFEVASDGAGRAAPPSGAVLSGLRDRVEALGGQLTVRFEPDEGIRLSGSLPLSR